LISSANLYVELEDNFTGYHPMVKGFPLLNAFNRLKLILNREENIFTRSNRFALKAVRTFTPYVTIGRATANHTRDDRQTKISPGHEYNAYNYDVL